MKLSDKFPVYREYDPLVEVRCVTPNTGRTIHRFFGTSPISPSGRYLAAFRLPFEDRDPQPGDGGQVILIDLETGEERVVSETAGWEPQVGANVQWGADDTQLFFNDVDTGTWEAFGVCMNPFSGRKRLLEGCVFEVSHSGRFVASPSAVRSRFSQKGYGVVIPDHLVPRYSEPSDSDGIYITDVETGECRLLLTAKDIVERFACFQQLRGGEFFFFQCKWNKDDSRLMMCFRWLSGEKRLQCVVTCDADGKDIRIPISYEEWGKGGHHMNWHPDGEHITMNLNIFRNGLRFTSTRYDGAEYRALLDDVAGSGHPSMHVSERLIVTDSYNSEYGAHPDGSVPIRLVTLPEGKEYELVRILTRTPYDRALRVDPHPAWDQSYRYIVFNGYHGNTRRVYIADVGKLVDALLS
ncbi:MAG: hypothetical protein GX549_04740 [Clostridiales bacterium]|nr:hypothetical protein [Clostridiales bacterium]